MKNIAIWGCQTKKTEAIMVGGSALFIKKILDFGFYF